MSKDSRLIPLEQRVNQLFATVIDTERNEVTSSAVANQLANKLGRSVSTEDIEALRQEGTQRAEEDLILALAEYFDMPAGFLSENPDDYYTTYVHLNLLIAQRDKKIPFVALRASSDKLGDASVQELTKYIGTIE